MTDDKLVPTLRRAMRAHDDDAPTIEAIRERLAAPRPVVRRRRWVPAAAAVAVLAVVAVGVAWSVSRDESGREPSTSDRHPPIAPAMTSTTVFYAASRSHVRPRADYWVLVPRQVTVRSSGDPVLDAVRALFDRRAPEGLMNWYRIGPEPVARVNSVTVGEGRITVDIDRSLRDPYPTIACVCPDAETVLQQLAWTVSTAAQSEAPIRLTENGQPAFVVDGEILDGAGLPNPYLIARSHQSFAWYREVCGPLEIVAVTPDGRRVDVPTHGGAAGSVPLRVGDSLRFEIRGGCFRRFSVVDDRTGALLARAGSDGMTLVARHPGRVNAVVWELDACTQSFLPSFSPTDCEGPPGVPVGSIAVDIRTD